MRAVAVVAVLACLVPACGKDTRPRRDPRIVELEHLLRHEGRDGVQAAAAEYRALRAEHPDALRMIADAHQRTGEKAAEFDVMRTIVTRGQGTNGDKVRAIRLAHERGRVDDKLYAAGLTWLNEALAAEPWCANFALLVEWSDGRPEHAAAFDRALAECPRDYERAGWLGTRATQSTLADDACRAVVHGAPDQILVTRCAENGAVPWQVAFAKGFLTKEIGPELAATVTAAPDATAHALLRVAEAPAVPRDEACAALARARAIETGWLPRAGEAAAIAGRYDALRKQRACP